MGIGVDIVELSRLDIENERFVRHILSDEEYVIFQSFPTKKRKREYLGGRFAAKEAVLKALGTGLREGSLQEIAVANDALGKPLVQLSGHFAALSRQLGVKNIQISLSHSRDFAVAYVIMEDDK